MLLEFAKQNWHLFAALAAIILLLLAEPLRRRSSGARGISALELPRVAGHRSGVVVDVSDAADYKQGHISGAVNIPLKELPAQIGRLKKHLKSPVILTCRNGVHAPKAAAVLRRNSFTDLYTLSGGIAAWNKENLPLEK